MQYAAALIEYIITGLISLIWIALLLSTNIDFLTIDYNKFKEVLLIVIFPLAYIAGIFIDTISSILFKALENLLGNQKKKTKPNDDNSYALRLSWYLVSIRLNRMSVRTLNSMICMSQQTDT